jgi:hypoxanthine phosphoribosyltransferase
MNFAPEELEEYISAETLEARIAEMGAEITKAYQNTDLYVIGVLNGCMLFYSDLVRHIDLPITCDFLGLSSYGADTKSSGVVKFTKDLSHSIAGKDILIVEDIVDTGLTLSYLQSNFKTRSPKSVRICSLLSKPARRKVEVPVDYVGFTIEDHFVVGYGLDLDGKYRNLPYIGRFS